MDRHAQTIRQKKKGGPTDRQATHKTGRETDRPLDRQTLDRQSRKRENEIEEVLVIWRD